MNQMLIDELEMPGEYFVINRKGAHKAIARRALKASVRLL